MRKRNRNDELVSSIFNGLLPRFVSGFSFLLLFDSPVFHAFCFRLLVCAFCLARPGTNALHCLRLRAFLLVRSWWKGARASGTSRTLSGIVYRQFPSRAHNDLGTVMTGSAGLFFITLTSRYLPYFPVGELGSTCALRMESDVCTYVYQDGCTYVYQEDTSSAQCAL